MNIKGAKLGQRYRLFVDDTGKVVRDKTTNNTVEATVIGEGTKMSSFGAGSILFGWRDGDLIPKNARSREGTLVSANITYIQNQDIFTHSLYVKSDCLVHSIVINKSEYDGCQCKKCHNFYPYAEPNQEDGTLICYSCRTSW